MEDFNQFQQNQERFRQILPNYNPQYTIYDYRVGFGRRVAAALIDTLLVIFITGIFAVVFGLFKEFENLNLQDLLNPEYMQKIEKFYLPLSFLITLLYFLMEIFFMATPGKMILGIMIADESMKYATTTQLVTRFALKHLDLFILLLYIITWNQIFQGISNLVNFLIVGAFLFCLRATKQSIYDQIARTAIYFKKEMEESNKSYYEVQ